MNSNLINPYENVGQQHNLYLDKIISKVGNTANITHNNKKNILESAIESVQLESGLENFEFDLIPSQNDESFLNELNKLSINPRSKILIQRLVEIDTNLAFLEQKKEILEIEKQILLKDFSNGDAVLPLVAVSVAKNSIKYWNDAQNNSKTNNFQSGLWLNLWNKLELAKSSDIWKADVKGCFDNGVELILLGGFDNTYTTISLIALKTAIASASEFIFSKKR
jgi:hypothetical protein